jgi:hypothetical protein
MVVGWGRLSAFAGSLVSLEQAIGGGSGRAAAREELGLASDCRGDRVVYWQASAPVLSFGRAMLLRR